MNTKLDKILAEISAGELIDKITILEIKALKISDKEKLKHVNKELSSLNEIMEKYIKKDSQIEKFKNQLKETNLKLWDIENSKREAEKNSVFDDKFIKLARDVYKFNDIRAKIKLDINNFLNSNVKEIKSYN